jgi:hypothetical protein
VQLDPNHQYSRTNSGPDLTSEGRENQLYSLYMEARRLVEDLSRSIGAMAPPAGLLQAPQGDGGDTAAADQPNQPPQQLMLATGSLLSSALFEVSDANECAGTARR